MNLLARSDAESRDPDVLRGRGRVHREGGRVGCWILAVIAILGLAPANGRAAIVTWVGPSSGSASWSAASNWEGGRVPGNGDDARILGGSTNLIVRVTGILSVRSLELTCSLQVTSDIGANTVFTVGTLVNRGIVRLESERPDRTTTLSVTTGTGLDNRGLLWAVAANGGARRIEGAIANRGRILVENGIGLGVGNRDRTFSAIDGRIDVPGLLTIEGGRLELTGGQWNGDVRVFNATTTVASSVTQPSTLRLLGLGSVLERNSSPVVTLWLDTDIGNQTTLKTAAGAFNDGRIVLGSSRLDRVASLDLAAGFTNRVTGVIEALVDGGGTRGMNGRLVNQGRLSATNIALPFAGTYVADGGLVTGDVQFLGVTVVPRQSPPEPNALQLFGATTLDGNNLPDLILRVISDVNSQAALLFNTNLINRGVITLESLRPDRVTSIEAGGRVLENRGEIRVLSTNGGGRRLRVGLVNKGRLRFDTNLVTEIQNTGAVFSQEAGSVEVEGSLAIVGGRVNVSGGQLTGDIRLFDATTFVAASATTPATLRVLGSGSTLVANASPAMTLFLDTDVGNQSILTTLPAAFNEGRLILGSARLDRVSRLELGAGFTNRPTGVIAALLDGGGTRALNGVLVNQGRLLATNITLAVTGTYRSDAGTVAGDVAFLDAQIEPLRSSAEPVALRLFGGSQLLRDNVSNLVLRVIGSLGAQGRLLFNTNLINHGVISLETERPDRIAILRGQDGMVVNGEDGLIVVTAANDGGRSIEGSLLNRGVLRLEYPLDCAAAATQHVNRGRIELGGQRLGLSGAFLNATGARIVGSGTITMNGGAFQNAGWLLPGTSPGRLSVVGNFVQAETGGYEVELATAAGPGTGHDLVEVSGGTATLNGGALVTRVLGTFEPAAETRFRVLSASGGITGRFARTPSLQVLPGRYLQTEYLPAALDLRTVAGVDSTLPPSIVLHPVSQTVEEQGAVQFVVAANGAGTLAFQWRRNGQAIPGATSRTLSLPRVLAGDFGTYDVVVSNAAGSSTSDPATLARKSTGSTTDNTLDYGDAPDAPYPTTLAHSGASQRAQTGFTLGASVDADDGTQQNAAASADGADEDGVEFLDPLVPGQSVRIRVVHVHPPNVAAGSLSAWIDWNANGSWAEAGERIINNQVLAARTNEFAVTVPANAVLGQTYARFRLYQDQYPGFAGASAEAGEVEDYRVEITNEEPGGGTHATRDFGDAPDTYQTLLASDGPRHLRDPELYLGKGVDVETNGFPNLLAIGDDANGTPDDEDGVTGAPFFVPGATATFTVSVVGTGKVDAWIDWNRDGDFADANERVLTGEAFATQSRSFTLTVPASAVVGGSYARFRLSKAGVNSWFGPAPDGEVEDYAVLIIAPQKDWGDAPTNFPTLAGADGARHTVVDDFHLGKSIDGENDGQPNANATGDDLAPAGAADDEDGVIFSTPLVAGQSAEIEVEASQAGRLDAWIDFGVDGTWAEATDRIFTARALVAGRNTLTFTVPATAKNGRTFARFRLSRAGVNTYAGDGGEGEVEDYRVTIDRDTGCELGCTGRDFWLTFPGTLAPDPANPVVPRLRFSGANGTTLTIAAPGLGFTLVTNIVGGGMTVTLPSTVDLGALNDAVLNRGIHVTATAPVALVAISQVRFTSDGYHALPAEVLTGEYVVAAYPNTLVGVPEVSGSQFAIVATQPRTTVVITPTAETGLHLAGIPYSVVLTNAGDCYQLRNTNDAPADLTGTLIEADQPVAAFGGHVCGNVNSGEVFYCDYLVEQMLPTERLGMEFFTTPLATRSGGETVRVVAARRNTTVQFDSVSVTLTNRGDAYETLLAQATHVTANKPVLVTQFASSSDFDGVANADPFMVTVPSRSHFTTTHTLMTAGTNFGSHYVTVVAPVSVTSLTLDGVAVSPAFAPVGASGYRYAHLPISQGVHSLTASSPIGAIVYGWSLYESYGWPSCLFFGDTTAPRLTCATNTVTVPLGVFGNDIPCKTRVPDLRPLVTVRDNCGIANNAEITQSPAPGSVLGVGSHEVVLSATDDHGNIGYCTITLNVVDPAPGTEVTLTCPGNLTVRCDDAEGATVNYTVEALRGCTPIAVTCTPPSGSRFPIGTTTVTCRITEPDVPVQECSFTVTVDCTRKRQVRIAPPVRPPPTSANPDPPAEIVLDWDPEAAVVLQAADDPTGPWTTVPTGVGRHVIQVLKERGRFFRLRVGP